MRTYYETQSKTPYKIRSVFSHVATPAPLVPMDQQ